jgi:hypothetical protein
MIPKIICFIFGHIRTWNEFTGEYGKELEVDRLSGAMVHAPIYIKRDYVECPRCAKRI